MRAPRLQAPVEVFLHPGEYWVGGAGHRIRTVLGSCVSIALWHPGRRIGAMSHYLLWNRLMEGAGGADARFGEEAMAMMLRELERMEVAPRECRAKIFGGANMFPRAGTSLAESVGQRNGNAARDMLRVHRIPIASESLFGEGHRTIVFDVSTGHVWSRQIRPVEAAALTESSA